MSTQQRNFFDHPPQSIDPPHVATSDTSAAAARSIKSKTANLRAKVLHYVAEQGQRGATDDELYQALGNGFQRETVRARRWELVRAGLVQQSDTRRPTSSGCTAAVWIITDNPEPHG